MIFHQATEAKKGTGGFRPTLLTGHHDEETERLTGLGAKLVSEEYQPPGSSSGCQAPVPAQARTDDFGPARDRDQAIAKAHGTFVRDVRNAAEKQADEPESSKKEA